MSKHKEIEEKIKAIMQSKISGYDYYFEWQKEPLAGDNGVEIIVALNVKDSTTEQRLKASYSATVYIYREYLDVCGNGSEKAAAKEQLRSDLESLIKSSDLNFEAGEIPLYEENNKKACWACDFKLVNFI